MRIRFGYVANALGLWDTSPSKTLTYARYSTLSPQERLEKLKMVTAANLQHTKRILHYNIAHEIEVYRFSSSLVPLATHPEVMWDFVTPFKKEWEELGQLVRQYGIRPSFHPNQFPLFTSPKEQITQNAVIDMQYHYQMFEAMNVLDNGMLNIHIGGAYGDKASAIKRFHKNIQTLPCEIKRKVTLENDDKTYHVEETLKTCEEENIPMVLDYHHHMANPTAEELITYLPRIFHTWANTSNKPKVHISSPKAENAYRSHADYVSLDFIFPFLKIAKEINQ